MKLGFGAMAFDETLTFIGWSRTTLSCLTVALVFLGSALPPWRSVLDAVVADETLTCISLPRTTLSCLMDALVSS